MRIKDRDYIVFLGEIIDHGPQPFYIPIDFISSIDHLY